MPKAEAHILDAGHFTLDTAADEIASLVRGFVGSSGWRVWRATLAEAAIGKPVPSEPKASLLRYWWKRTCAMIANALYLACIQPELMEEQSGDSVPTSQETNLSDSGFVHTVERDPSAGWNLTNLSYRDPKDLRNNLEVRIVPEAGANLYSMKLGETELLAVPNNLSDLSGFRYGFPVLYPTPNLVRDSQFDFDGRTFKFIPNEGPHFLHGLVHSLSWEASVPWSDSNGAGLTASLDWTPAQPAFPLFPIVHRLSLNFLLHSRGVKFEFTVENLDDKRLPFGFALHPWFRVLGSRAGTWLQVPAQKHMEAIDLLPTGTLKDLEGSVLDLRNFVSLEPLDLDDVYWGMSPDRPAAYVSYDEKIKVSLTGSAEFTHMVVYTPRGSPFFCMENQTCSTDAHNLFGRGFEKEAHLLIVERGKQMTGWVQVEVGRLDQGASTKSS